MANTDVRRTQTGSRGTTRTSAAVAGTAAGTRTGAGSSRGAGSGSTGSVNEKSAASERTENAGPVKARESASSENINGKKPKRRMKKQVRKTVAGLFLASAVVVAAIPTPEAAASFGSETPSETIKVSLESPVYDDSASFSTSYTPSTDNPLYPNYTTADATSSTTYTSKVPLSTLDWVLDAERTVYTSGDGRFQFVYMRRYQTDSDRYAVILGYSGSDTTLEIPNVLEGYLKYSDNVSSSGYCLVAKNSQFLYYQTYEQKSVANQKYYTVTFVEDTTYDGHDYHMNDRLEDVGGNVLTEKDGELYLVTYNIDTVNEVTGYHLISDPSVTITIDEYNALSDEDKALYAEDTTPKQTTREIYNKTQPFYVYKYNPCFYSSISSWETYSDADLYYYDGTNYVQVGDNNDDYNRIQATVAYIGQEYLVNGGSTGTWKVGGPITDPSQGVFAEKSSITNLSFGSDIEGIGDFAFYGCSTLSGVSFSSSLETIGNGAFSECINLSSCNIAPNANLLSIGKDAFYDCRSLTSFSTNVGLRAIGDSAFENCTGLTSVYINGESAGGSSTQVALQTIGNHAFRNCTALSGLTLPKYYGESVPLEIDTFEGCTGLQFIKISNSTIDFDAFHKDSYTEVNASRGTNDRWTYSETGNFPKCSQDWEDFLATVPDSFYFEGPADSAIHNTCLAESISFKYLDEDRYERKVYEIDERDADEGLTYKSAAVLYQINSNGEILQADIVNRVNEDGTEMSGSIQSRPINLTIPEKIGPWGIDTIGPNSFANNCYLTKVTIPASVHSIGDRAFAGCHNLETVIYTDASQVQNIGTDAFRTQDCNYSASVGALTCNACAGRADHKDVLGDYTTEATTPATKLTFCGKMIGDDGNDTYPFAYAMNGVTRINNDDQTAEFIRYHSGWPTNLVVQYDYNSITGAGEVQLVEYPRYSTYQNAYDFCKSLPYLDELNDKDTFDYYVDLVDKAVIAYNNYKSDPSTYPAPTARQLELINAALNIVVPSNVDAIGKTIVSDGSKNYTVGIFSGEAYDSDGYPIYKMGDGSLLYTDQYGKLWTDAMKSSPYTGEDYEVLKNPYVPVSDITNTELESITLNGVDRLEPFTFYGNTALREAAVIGADYIGDYAFDGCKKLENATIGSNVTDTGLRPFRGCKKLANIDILGGNPNFTYNNGLLKHGDELVQCLESRGGRDDAGNYISGQPKITSTEMGDVKTIRPEAFMDCDSIGGVDLSGTTIDEIPYRCFRNSSITSASFGDEMETIGEEAFYDTKSLSAVTIPYSVVSIAPDAFADTSTKATDSYKDNAHHMNPVYVSCVEGSYGDKYAKSYVYLSPEYGEVYITHKVYYYDNCPILSSAKLLSRETVKDGGDGTPPAAPDHTADGYTFSKWTDYTNITKDTDVYAFYIETPDAEYTVKFYDTKVDKTDADGNVTVESSVVQLGSTQTVRENGIPEKPADPVHPGWTFNGWIWEPADPFENGGVHADSVAYADYTNNLTNEFHTVTFVSGEDNSVIATQEIKDGGKIYAPTPPTYSKKEFDKWITPANFDYDNVTMDATIIAIYKAKSEGGGGKGGGGGGGGGEGGGGGGGGSDSTPKPTASPKPSSNPDDAKKYTVSVSGGSGSGQYPAGAIVAVNAFDMGAGQVFDKWTTSTAGVAFANPSSPSTSFVMPAANVAVTATYKTGGSGSTSSSGSGGSSSGNGGSTTKANTGKTQVDITKGGISNTGIAGATVSGSTDNFIVKITDDQTASELALRALQNSYGDITRLKYLPMDISLYDSTGRTKIADTAGLSVAITMPLPDELREYAGNNKVASVAGGVLEPLNSRFTTVDGVPCIAFTATHFSPYVIYVDTGNLTESTIDYTPKTGDPIHPKWFLALGLSAIAAILFFKRDRKPAAV